MTRGMSFLYLVAAATTLSFEVAAVQVGSCPSINQYNVIPDSDFISDQTVLSFKQISAMKASGQLGGWDGTETCSFSQNNGAFRCTSNSVQQCNGPANQWVQNAPCDIRNGCYCPWNDFEVKNMKRFSLSVFCFISHTLPLTLYLYPDSGYHKRW